MDCKLLILLVAVLHGPYNSAAFTTRLDYSQCCLEEANPTEAIQQVRPLPNVGLELGFVEEPPKKKNRDKRFPIHLDPLYQYRFLARSGRKS